MVSSFLYFSVFTSACFRTIQSHQPGAPNAEHGVSHSPESYCNLGGAGATSVGQPPLWAGGQQNVGMSDVYSFPVQPMPGKPSVCCPQDVTDTVPFYRGQLSGRWSAPVHSAGARRWSVFWLHERRSIRSRSRFRWTATWSHRSASGRGCCCGSWLVRSRLDENIS